MVVGFAKRKCDVSIKGQGVKHMIFRSCLTLSKSLALSFCVFIRVWDQPGGVVMVWNAKVRFEPCRNLILEMTTSIG